MPFIVQNLKKTPRANPELWGWAIFGSKMFDWPHPNKHFLGKIFDIISIYLLTHFIVPNFQKFLQEAQDYEDAPFLDPKWASFPKRKFFRKPVDKPSSYYSSLSTFQKWKSDINLLMKYFGTFWHTFFQKNPALLHIINMGS